MGVRHCRSLVATRNGPEYDTSPPLPGSDGERAANADLLSGVGLECGNCQYLKTKRDREMRDESRETLDEKYGLTSRRNVALEQKVEPQTAFYKNYSYSCNL